MRNRNEPTQVFQQDIVIKYDWRRIQSERSLKNSHTFFWRGNKYLAATDMLDGGTVVLKHESGGWLEHMHAWEGYTMMWAPCSVELDQELWFLCCDTNGGDTSHWWDFMRIYRHRVDLENKIVGRLQYVPVPEDNCGLIDPCLVRFGRWWYLFYVKLWDSRDNEWWDPHYSVSENPFGPFREKIHLGLRDRGIDEAVKIVIGTDRQLYITWGSGDSGINGSSFLGLLAAKGQSKEGWIFWTVKELAEIKASNSVLCTALDTNDWPSVIATFRKEFTGMRDGFYLAELI